MLALDVVGSSGCTLCVYKFGSGSGAAKFDAAQLKPLNAITQIVINRQQCCYLFYYYILLQGISLMAIASDNIMQVMLGFGSR